ncbi:helix-turn-helix transcriptional regulator [Streptomyces sp. NPDC094153]|uniref:helix-turn-helix domain-containing protein n=1 Tax=Streptomyces sp. NPDC094153 TaxID=3366058 RepID=UPI003826245D
MISTTDLRKHITAAADELHLPLTLKQVDQLADRVAAELVLGPEARAQLTPQMCVILAGVASGENNPETAARLCLSTDTVKTHKHRMFKRLGARNGAHAVAIGMRLGILRPVETGDRP